MSNKDKSGLNKIRPIWFSQSYYTYHNVSGFIKVLHWDIQS